MSHNRLIVLVCVLLVLSGAGAPVSVLAAPTIYRVSPHDVDRFTWAQLGPGDTVILGPGTYRTTIRLNVRGTPAAPITIQAGGSVVFFGGRLTPLPYCGQRGYRLQPAKPVALDLRSAQHVVIDGGAMRGLTIHGYNGNAIELSRASQHVTVRNVEIYDNGTTLGTNPHHGRKGVNLSGSNITFERAIIHDNAADAFQSGGGLHNFTLRQSWLYNSRTAPNGDTFNRCTHQDGIQVYAGGVQSGMLIEDSVFGPGLLQGLILGETNNGHYARVDNVTIRNTRFVDADGTHVIDKDTQPRGWVFDRVTFEGGKKSLRYHGKDYYVSSLNGSATVAAADLPSAPTLLDRVPPWIRLALGGWLAGDDAPAGDVPPPLDLADIPGGACKIAAAYALEAMARTPSYSQKNRLGPNSYDCSGLTHMAYKQAGVNIGWVVSDQMRNGRRTSCTLADLKGAATTCWAPGDLAVLAGYCSTPGCHISIYIKDGYFADCLNEQEGCKLWQPGGHWYQNYFTYGVRFDTTCAKERES